MSERLRNQYENVFVLISFITKTLKLTVFLLHFISYFAFLTPIFDDITTYVGDNSAFNIRNTQLSGTIKNV